MQQKSFAVILHHGVSLLLALGVLWPAGMAVAQTAQPNGPVYIVQEGDSLWDIAVRFGVTMDDLEKANGIIDPNQLTAGEQLVIPGLEGIQGVLVTQTVSYGETLRSLSRRYQIPESMLARLNHISSPAELFAGYSLVLPEKDASTSADGRALLPEGQSLLELAVLQNTNPWTLVQSNDLNGTWAALPGDTLLFPKEKQEGPGGLPGEVTGVEIQPLPLLQGKTSVIRLTVQGDITLSGSLMGHELHFFRDQDGSYVAMQGIHAMADPGIYPMELHGTAADGTPYSFSQMVWVKAVDYPYDRPLTVNPTTIDPAVTQPEDSEWAALAAPVTPERMWNGKFDFPSPLDLGYCLETNDCWASRFGNRRSYNGGPYNAFHTGLDIVGSVGTKIYAAADGIVVFTGPLTVRGNATVIDHGWGVYTAYLHQSEIDVHVGDHVKAGQVIGLVGATGRVEGPHLHFEVWVGGVQVDPLDWLKNVYP